MAQAVSRRPFTAEARVLVRVSTCGICGGQNGAGKDFFPSSSVFPCQYHSTMGCHTRIIWEMNNRPHYKNVNFLVRFSLDCYTRLCCLHLSAILSLPSLN
jgi:hypothetical protein